MSDKEVLEMFIEAGLVSLPEIHLNACWAVYDGELNCNKDGNQNDLKRAAGNTYAYAGYIKNQKSLGDYLIFTIDSDNGYDYQVILSTAKEVGYE